MAIHFTLKFYAYSCAFIRFASITTRRVGGGGGIVKFILLWHCNPIILRNCCGGGFVIPKNRFLCDFMAQQDEDGLETIPYQMMWLTLE